MVCSFGLFLNNGQTRMDETAISERKKKIGMNENVTCTGRVVHIILYMVTLFAAELLRSSF